MIANIILLVTLLTYSIIVSQSFMYILALKDVQLKLDPNAYIQFRKLINTSMVSRFTYAVYTALLFTLALVILTIKNPDSLQFITAVIAFAALVADTIVTVKGNLPVNVIINTWAHDNYPANWATYRTKWLQFFQYRQIANITGFVALLIGVVFG